jgi:hypothetical protein
MITVNTQFNNTDIIRQLNALSDDLKDKALRAGVAEVSKAGLMQLKQAVPKDTGSVQQSLNRKLLSKRARAMLNLQEGTVAMLVGPNRKVKGLFRSRIANVLEGGARRHEIKPGKSNRALDLLYEHGIKKKASILYNKRAAGNGPFKRRFILGKIDPTTGQRLPVNHPGIAPRRWMGQANTTLQSQAESLFYRGLANYLDRRQAST